MALTAIGSLGLSACGSSSSPSSNGEAAKSAKQILADAVKATGQATTFSVAGTINESGAKVTLDVTAGHGKGGGTISLSGASIALVVHGSDLYLKANAAAWKVLGGGGTEGNAAATVLGGNWLQTTTTNADFGSFGEFVDVTKLTAKLAKPSGALSKGKTTTFDAAAAIPLLDHGGTGGTLYVAATGKPYILGIANTGTKQKGKLTFTDYGKAAVPAVPSGALSLSKLEAAGSS